MTVFTSQGCGFGAAPFVSCTSFGLHRGCECSEMSLVCLWRHGFLGTIPWANREFWEGGVTLACCSPDRNEQGLVDMKKVESEDAGSIQEKLL